MSGDYCPDRDLQAIGLAAWEAELEIERLRDLVTRARALILGLESWVECETQEEAQLRQAFLDDSAEIIGDAPW